VGGVDRDEGGETAEARRFKKRYQVVSRGGTRRGGVSKAKGKRMSGAGG